MSSEFEAFQRVARQIQEVGGDEISAAIVWRGDALRVNVRGRGDQFTILRSKLESLDPSIPVDWDDAPVPSNPAHGGSLIQAKEQTGTIAAWAWSKRHHCVVLLASGHVVEGTQIARLVLEDSVPLREPEVQLPADEDLGWVSDAENSRDSDAAYLQPLAADDTYAGTEFRPMVCDRDGQQLGWAIFRVAQPLLERDQEVALVGDAGRLSRLGRITATSAEVRDMASKRYWKNVVVAKAIDDYDASLAQHGDSGALLYLRPNGPGNDHELTAVGIVAASPTTSRGSRLVAFPIDAVLEQFGLATLAIGPFASFIHHAFRDDTEAPFHFYKMSRGEGEARYPSPEIGLEFLALLGGDPRFAPLAEVLVRKRAQFLRALVTYHRGVRLEIHSMLSRLFVDVRASVLNGPIEELIPMAFDPVRRPGVRATLRALRRPTPSGEESAEDPAPLFTGNEVLRRSFTRLALLNVLETRPLDGYEAGMLAHILDSLRDVLELRSPDTELFARVTAAFRLGEGRTICAILEDALHK